MKINYLELSNTQILKQRFKDCRDELKENHDITITDFRQFVLTRDKDFDSLKGYDAIINAWYGKTPNIRLCELLTEYRDVLNN